MEPGSLRARLGATRLEALRRGALQPILTEQGFIEDSGVRFLVHVVSSLAGKRPLATLFSRPGGDREVDPFLPYEEDLFVADASSTHVILLNRFPVLDDHLLIVTRDFEDQESALTAADFSALWACMAEFEGLAFYNSGRGAGASQPHKHLQMVPLPLAPAGPAVPIEPLLRGASFCGPVGGAPALPFPHVLARTDPGWFVQPRSAGEPTRELYLAMLEAAGLKADAQPEGWRPLAPYNLLITPEWMLLVPRARERYETIPVNALGFAGAFLARDAEERRLVERAGPMAILQGVAGRPAG